MEGKIYNSSTVEKCLEMASQELNVPMNLLEYKVIEEKKGLFKKSASIEVYIKDEPKEAAVQEVQSQHGTIAVVEGKLVVKNPKDGGSPATITPSNNIYIIVNEKAIENKTSVFEESQIEVRFKEEEAKRILNINITPDRMKAVINIEYIAKCKYKLKDLKESNHASLSLEIVEEEYPPLYTLSDIRNELSKVGITYGIVETNLIKCTIERDINEMIIAEGVQAIDEEPEILDIKFNASGMMQLKEDKKGKIDYRNLSAIETVRPGDLLAVKIDGKPGNDGINIRGEIQKHKLSKKITLKAGNGTEIREDNKVYATIEGKPSVKNGVFIVNPVHEINADVDMKSGNVKFLGDVLIHGDVKQGMKIEAGNAIVIDKNVESSEVMGKGDITIKGNVILSKIFGGGEDVFKLQHLNNLEELKKQLKLLMDTVVEIKRFNLLGKNASDGEIVKALIENKFKVISKLCINIIRDNLLDSSEDNEVVIAIKDKLVGLAPLKIKHFGEIDDIISLLSMKSENMRNALSIPVTVNISYCQDSTIQSSGDIIFTGKGMYVSNIIANKSVYFNSDKTIARGGTIKANSEIRCKTVGSSGGVTTKLMVGAKGHIWADVAFQNTIFAVGGREYLLENPSKNIHVYIHESGDLMVDKLLL
ncbi:flagellar assembly protein A [Desnuesiella massiliensis]|uniref:flagellar assembly protein A n=1 Tax=Desnuesiella massiliensis TaxID=1650662 RepID=UPI0006E13A61|nr:flagellar assembly protein A [Desnuesiella massiliensis]